MANCIDSEPTVSPGPVPCFEPDFASRKRLQSLAERAWRQTVTHYRPAPWLVALDRERMGRPFKPGHRPAANR